MKGNPLTADIREKFIEYDTRTQDIAKMNNTIIIGPIEIRLGTGICEINAIICSTVHLF